MRTQLLPVEFHGDTVVLADFEGQPYVVMRTVVANLGLSWQPQHIKLMEKFGSTVTEIVTVAEDGKLRSMVCLPLRKLPAWLYTLQPNKVKPELRDKMMRYQEECEEALYRHWTTDSASSAGSADTGKLAWIKERNRVLAQLGDAKHPSIARAMWQSLKRIDEALGMDTAAAEGLAPILQQKPLPGMGDGA